MLINQITSPIGEPVVEGCTVWKIFTPVSRWLRSKEGREGKGETTTIAHTNLAPKNAPLFLRSARIGVLTLCHFLGSGRRLPPRAPHY